MEEESEGEQNPRSSYGIKGFFKSKSAVLIVALGAAFVLVITIGPIRSTAQSFLASAIDTARQTFSPGEVYVGEISLNKSENSAPAVQKPSAIVGYSGTAAVKAATPAKTVSTVDPRDKQISALNDKINALQAQLDAAARDIVAAPATSAIVYQPQVQAPPAPIAVPVPVSNPVGDGKVLVSEIMAGADGNANYEFIELYNAGSAPVDLTGWSIKKKSSTGSETSLVAASRLSGKIIQPGKYLLMGNKAGYQGSISLDVPWPSSYTLAYTNNSIVLYDNGARVEEIFWAEIPKGQSFSRTNWDGSQFALTSSPAPQNSQSQ